MASAPFSTAPTHTPGPWFVSTSPVLAVVAEEDHPVIAELTVVGDGDRGTELANARLIAAAPEMLAFVARHAKRNPIYAKGPEAKQLIADAIALVAKATTA